MNKTEMIDTVSKNTGLTKKAVSEVFEGILAVTIQNLRSEGVSLLPGIGKLERKTRPARQGRNPQTGETVQIEERNVVKFKPSASLNGAVQ
jgi:DNA-binding protein HU-beta